MTLVSPRIGIRGDYNHGFGSWRVTYSLDRNHWHGMKRMVSP